MNCSIVHHCKLTLHDNLCRIYSEFVVQELEQVACCGQVIKLLDACAVDVQNCKNSSVYAIDR